MSGTLAAASFARSRWLIMVDPAEFMDLRIAPTHIAEMVVLH
jgi:hypothetical protein